LQGAVPMAAPDVPARCRGFDTSSAI